jgi:type IV secretion system protein VirB8
MVAKIKRWFAAAIPVSRHKPQATSTAASKPHEVIQTGGNDAVAWYLDQALKFERSKVEGAQEKARIADRRSVLSGCVALAAVFGIGALGILKRPNPPAVLRVNDATGKVDVLPTTANGHVTFNQKTDRHDLHTYVVLRESYDWETIEDTHHAVMFMSDDREKQIYDTFVRGAAGPLKMLKDQARILARVGSITFVGATAQVFFSRQLIPLNPAAQRPDPTFWIATVAFTRVNVPEKQDEQDIDPDGFRCTSYEVSRDWTRTAGDAVPGATASGVVVPPSTGGAA